MSIARRIAKNTVVLYGAQAITSALSLVLVAFMGRNLGAANYGIISFAMVFAGLFGILTNLGMNELLIREVARDREQAGRYVGNVLALRLALCILVIVLMIGTVYLMGYPLETVYVVAIFGLNTMLTSLAAIFRVAFRAFERMEFEAVSNIVYRLVSFALAMVLLVAGYGIIPVALAFLTGGIMELLVSLTICTVKIVRPRIQVDWGFLGQSLKTAFPFTLSNVFIMIYIRIDTVMLSTFKGNAVVGWYNAAYNLVLGLEPVIFLFMTAVFPVMSRLFVSSQKALTVAYEKAFKYLLIAGLPASVGLAVLADRIIVFLYSEGFEPSVTSLRILAWTFVLLCMYRPMLYLLGSINRQGWMAVVAGAGALVNIVLNLVLIPSLSYTGAAIATIATECLVTVASWYVIARYFHVLAVHRLIARPLIASTVMGGVIYAVNRYADVNLFLLIILGAALYAVLILLLRTFSDEDRELFRQVTRIRRGSGQTDSA